MATKIFLAGVSCAGKTSIGARLAERLGYLFNDLDVEIERHFSISIERLKSKAVTPYSFRKLFAAVALKKLLENNQGQGLVIALPPSGLMKPLYALLKGRDSVVVVLQDTADNILKRITFYDEDSRPMTKTLTDEEQVPYRNLIVEDIEYFERSYRKADIKVDIAGLDVDRSAAKIESLLRERALLPAFTTSAIARC